MFLLLAASLPSLLNGAPPNGCVTAPTPRVNLRANVARATTSPWVESNAARYTRKPEATYCVEAPGKSAALAAAEAFAFGIQARIKAADGAAQFGEMLDFLKALPNPGEQGPMTNIGVVDDGSAATVELMNLLSRRNLLYRVVAAPDSHLDINVTGPHAADPSAEAYEIRQKLGDSRRLLRLYGSEVVVGRLTGDGSHVRLHLLNYSNRPVNGLRVRILGNFPKSAFQAFGLPGAALADFSATGEATEFTVQSLNEYAVIDLTR